MTSDVCASEAWSVNGSWKADLVIKMMEGEERNVDELNPETGRSNLTSINSNNLVPPKVPRQQILRRYVTGVLCLKPQIDMFSMF